MLWCKEVVGLNKSTPFQQEESLQPAFNFHILFREISSNSSSSGICWMENLVKHWYCLQAQHKI